MCCGQPTRRLDDAACQWLYNRYLGLESKRVLCAQFRIGSEEFERALAVGQAMGPWQPVPLAQTSAPTFTSLP
jgi:hypothetical protein